uniref:Photosystem I assembly protein Ycf4 n=1 Tax=Helminthora furcellata TaxID=1884666 RepID=A0A1G4NR39_9FLOR|nr:Photosystem I assembly protein Ycf4 [Helminthora furcellata]SCW21122.1 Photosystem I assembly protein Ycf4 [Helminthora furcellata]SCW23982.1 Photosystem I assembly protein Ycf4 [Helminthora furcellata]
MLVRQDNIQGSRRFSNYWWAFSILSGGLGFFLAGLSSYFSKDLLPFTSSAQLLFIPQGVIMTFYGTTALFLSIFLWFTILWDVGGGYNRFDTQEGLVTIFRLGFPGKYRTVCLKYAVKDIKSIKVSIQEGLTPKREIYLRTKDNREIPLTRVGEPLMLSEIENQATELARLLGVNVEGI